MIGDITSYVIAGICAVGWWHTSNKASALARDVNKRGAYPTHTFFITYYATGAICVSIIGVGALVLGRM